MGGSGGNGEGGHREPKWSAAWGNPRVGVARRAGSVRMTAFQLAIVGYVGFASISRPIRSDLHAVPAPCSLRQLSSSNQREFMPRANSRSRYDRFGLPIVQTARSVAPAFRSNRLYS